jgi:hypothetical protein
MISGGSASHRSGTKTKITLLPCMLHPALLLQNFLGGICMDKEWFRLINVRQQDTSSAVKQSEMIIPVHAVLSLQNFLGGMDEEWFRLIHVSIEAAAAPAIAALQPLQQAAQQVGLAAVGIVQMYDHNIWDVCCAL